MNTEELFKQAEKVGCEITMKRANGCTRTEIKGADICVVPLIVTSLNDMKDNGVVNNEDLLFIIGALVDILEGKSKEIKEVA